MMPQQHRYILAIDSFKGCLSSEEAAMAAANGITECYPDAVIIPLSVSDGGDGMLNAFTSALHADIITTDAHDALMRPIKAAYGITADGTAVIETAQACGLSLIKPEERDIMTATTFGVGEMIADAIARGCRHFIIGLGGSATSDCGIGMMKALNAIPFNHIDIILACDVVNPLYGDNGAARVFGPQKGATPEQVTLLDNRARAFAENNRTTMGIDRSAEEGAGAAGGLGYAFMQFMNARMESGAELLLKLTDFDHLINNADCVITGEGSADRQTLMGKLPYVIMRHARNKDIPTWLIAGRVSDKETLMSAGFSLVESINPPHISLRDALKTETAKRNISSIIKQIIKGQ